ncbi:MAG: flippase-like domain-containing protein [Aquificaceae bacterium]
MKKLLSLILALLFLLFLFHFVPLEELIESLRQVKAPNLVFAFLLYSLSQIFRSIRWKLLIKGVSFFDLFLINSANIMFNNLLPARTGEVSWFYYLKRIKVSWSFSLWSFFLGRLYDLLSLFSLLLFTLALVQGLMFLPFFALLLISLGLPWLYQLLPKRGKLGEVKDFIKRETSFTLALYLFLLSSLSSIFKFAGLLLLLNLKDIDLYKSFLAFLGGELSSVLPIHSFMGLGTYEFAFSLPLKVLGESLKEWIKMGFIFHSFLLISSFLWGIPSALLLTVRSENR